MHARKLPCNSCLPSMVLTAQAIFLLECWHTHTVTDATNHPTHASTTAGMGNEYKNCVLNWQYQDLSVPTLNITGDIGKRSQPKLLMLHLSMPQFFKLTIQHYKVLFVPPNTVNSIPCKESVWYHWIVTERYGIFTEHYGIYRFCPSLIKWWDASMCCVWVKVQICIWPSWCHCHSLSLAPVNPDWFYLCGFIFLVLAHPDSPGQNPRGP